MIIDWHTHLIPPLESGKPAWNGRCQMVIENILGAQEQAGIDITVASNTTHYLQRRSPPDALEALRQSNRYLAEIQDRYNGRIYGLASILPGGGEKHLRELERAITEDGLKGVLVTSSFKGVYLDDPEVRPFFDLAARLDIPVMIHPPTVGFGEERMREFRLASSVGRPFDSCLALSRLILYGVLEAFPTLKIVATHLGGGITEVIGRLDYNYALQTEGFYARDEDIAPMLIKRRPSEYLKNIYLDSVCYHLPAAKCAIETVGVDHFVFGTDAPPLTPLKQLGLDMIYQLPLDAAGRDKVLAGNARKLLKLD
jgi:aminocarboxymuconate-semialdehyde decarboxylase